MRTKIRKATALFFSFLTQETFLRAYQSLERSDGSCKLSVWLCSIAKHLLYQYWQKNQHEIAIITTRTGMPIWIYYVVMPVFMVGAYLVQSNEVGKAKSKLFSGILGIISAVLLIYTVVIQFMLTEMDWHVRENLLFEIQNISLAGSFIAFAFISLLKELSSVEVVGQMRNQILLVFLVEWIAVSSILILIKYKIDKKCKK